MSANKARLKGRDDFERGSIFDDEYRILKYVLKYTGLWPKQKKFDRLCLYICNVTVSLNIISRTLVEIYKNRDDPDAATFHAVSGISVLVGFLLFLTNFHKNYALAIILDFIDEFYRAKLKTHHKDLIQRRLMLGRKLTLIGLKIGIGISVLLFSLQILAILLSCEFKIPEIYDCLRMVSLDKTSDPHILIHLSCLLFAMLFSCMPNVLVYGIYETMIVITLYLRWRVTETDIKDLRPSHSEEIFRKECRLRVLSHRDAVKLIHLDNDLYAALLLWGVFSFICAMTVAIYNLESALKSLEKALIILPFFSMTFFMTFCLCWFGQRIIEENDHMKYAIYESKWYDMSKKQNMMINIFQMSCFHPMETRAYGVLVLGTELFNQVMRTSFSYYTFLKAVGEN